MQAGRVAHVRRFATRSDDNQARRPIVLVLDGRSAEARVLARAAAGAVRDSASRRTRIALNRDVHVDRLGAAEQIAYGPAHRVGRRKPP